MGLFDFLRKGKADSSNEEQMRNYPQMLYAKLLFVDKPELNSQSITNELKLFYSSVDSSASENTLLYFFPDIKVVLAGSQIPAQCTIISPNEDNIKSKIEAAILQQNWHWDKAAEVVEACKYEVLLSDFMTKGLNYKIRVDLFMNFLAAVTQVAEPQAIYSVCAEKIISPIDIDDFWGTAEQRTLHGIVNVRLFNISNGEPGDILMDTIGLHLLGLPDFQILFNDLDESAVSQLLWNYAYYIYEQGDTIEDGNTLQGLNPGSKWKCERQVAVVAPERIVIHVFPS
ncbi:MAG TPA: DUF4261 domain-containing protein [Hymenobacter sp.]